MGIYQDTVIAAIHKINNGFWLFPTNLPVTDDIFPDFRCLRSLIFFSIVEYFD